MSKLYIVPTPIGNLKDITHRALDIMSSADFIIAEDTRTSGSLLNHFSISKPLVSFHQHNEHRIVEQLVERIRNHTAALISDAGTPGISDPGFLLVRACIEADIEVETLPGATAFVPALVNSGFPCDRFYFHGFLPHKKGRVKDLEFIKSLGMTAILYESPHRLLKALEQIAEVFGADHMVSISREISKIYEETKRGTVTENINYFSQKPVKGEIVIVISAI
jgi:16S rRNA (cytidine1402-2'-O)-methyltransferase